MNIVIGGGGSVGFIVAEYFSREGHNVVVVEQQKKNVKSLQDYLDVDVVHGRATSMSVLKSAKIDDAEFFLALTDNDESNILACNLAKHAGVPKKIARLNKSFCGSEGDVLVLRELGVDEIVDTEGILVHDLCRQIQYPGAADIKHFFDEKYVIAIFSFEKDSPYYGKRLEEIDIDIFHIPLAYSKISHVKPYDKTQVINEFLYVYYACEQKNLDKLYKLLFPERKSVEIVMIYGTGYKSKNTALLLSDGLTALGVKEIIIVSDNEEDAEYLSASGDSRVLLGDPSRPRFARVENLKQYDAFIGISENFEKNIFSCMLAYQENVPLTFSFVRFPEHVNFVSAIPLTSFLNPAIATANQIMRYHKADSIISRTVFNYEQVEAIEFIVKHDSWLNGKKICNLGFKESIVVAVKRNSKFLDPTSENLSLNSGDIVLLFLFDKEKEILKNV